MQVQPTESLHGLLDGQRHAAALKYYISEALAVLQIGDCLLVERDFLAMSCREQGGSELHLSERNRGVFAFPVYPNDSLQGKREFSAV